MITVSKRVESYMRTYPFLSKFLRQGIINYRALARTIEPEISHISGEKVSLQSIAVSLQRLHSRDKHILPSMIGRLRGVAVVSDIYAITTGGSTTAYTIAADILSQNQHIDNPFLTVLSGQAETTYLVEKALVAPLVQSVGTNIISRQADLVALIITRELTHITEVGGVSYPLQVLAENGILVHAVAATEHEEIIIVADESADRATSVLRQATER